MSSTETLRSSYTLDGVRIFLVFSNEKNKYFLATRWVWLSSFDNIWDACDAFEVLEMTEGDTKKVAKVIKMEVKRTPHWFAAKTKAQGRASYLLSCTEKRLSGLSVRVVKGVEYWYA